MRIVQSGEPSEQLAPGQLRAKLSRGKNEDAILCLAHVRLEADDDAPLDARMILQQSAQSLEMIRRHPGRGFCFYRQLHVIHDEVDFDPARQAPVAKPRKGLAVIVVRAQFVEDPVFERLAVEF